MNAPEPFRPGVMRIRRALVPHWRWLSLLVLPILLVPLADSLAGWMLFGEIGRKVFGFALLLALLYFVLVAPGRSEIDEMRDRKRRGTRS